MNGAPNNFRVAQAGTAAPNGNGPKVDPNDPQVRKLVYNAYREMLSKKHARANDIIDNAPQELVTNDQGLGSRIESMRRQQSELKGGSMNAGGPPPPPPPPPIPGIIPSLRLPSEIPDRPAMNNPPAALASAMMKDRKPFTYTPGGLDLSEIRSPRMQRRLYRNAQSEGVKPSPLAQQPQPGQPPSAASSAPQGLPIQVLPMPGVGMGPQNQPQPKEAPKPVKPKSVCGPAPPPPPFVITSENSFTMPVSSPQSSVPSTISSPPISSSPTTSPSAPQPQLAKEPGPSSIPVAPPLPTQTFSARRGSIVNASPPTSPLVSTIPCEPSPPPLPPPQAVRVPVTPPVPQNMSAIPLPKEPEEDSSSVISPSTEDALSPEIMESSEVSSPPVVQNSFIVPEPIDSSDLPQSTSTPVKFIPNHVEPDRVSSPVLGKDVTHEVSLLHQSPQKSPSPFQDIAHSEKQITVEEIPAQMEVDLPGSKENGEREIALSSPVVESPSITETAGNDLGPLSLEEADEGSFSRQPEILFEPPQVGQIAVKQEPTIQPQEESGLPEEISRQPSATIMSNACKEPSPVRQKPDEKCNIANQAYSKEHTPEKQAPNIEPTVAKHMPSIEPSTINLAPTKTPAPKEPPNIEPSTFMNLPNLDEILNIKKPVKQPESVPSKDSDAPVIFSPIPVKEMPLKEPTPVRQIYREPTPVRQATLKNPVISDIGPSAPSPPQSTGLPSQSQQSNVPAPQIAANQSVSRPAQSSQFTATRAEQQPGNTILRQVPAQPAGLKRQSSLPESIQISSTPVEPPVVTHIPIQQPSSTNPPVPKTNLSKQNSLSQPLPVQPVPINTSNEPVKQSKNVPTHSQPLNSTPVSATPSSTGVKGSRLVRQSSLPTKPTPPQATSLNEGDAAIGAAQTSFVDQNRIRSPTTGLHRAPLPWMSGLRREPSPPPMFAQHAQNIFARYQQHNRFIRQSSLGPEGTIEFTPRVENSSYPSGRPQRAFQRQQSLPPPQKAQQERHEPQPVRVQPQSRPQPIQHQPQAQYNSPRVQNMQTHPQLQQPHNHQPQTPQQQPQPKSQPIRIQHQVHPNQQTRVIPIQVEQTSQAKHKPRERIIPIMVEGESPPRETQPLARNAPTNSSGNERFIPIRRDGEAPSVNNGQNNFQQINSSLGQHQHQQNPLHHPQPNWNTSSGSSFNHSSLPSHPVTTLSGGGQGGAFLPYNSFSSPSSLENNGTANSNNNPLDALHQMQQSLAQLNSGLENAFPRFIQKKMSDTITPRTTPSNQYPNQNGDQASNSAEFGEPVQSRSFRVLQNVLETQDNAEPQGPIHIPKMKHAQPPNQYQPQPNLYQQQPQKQYVFQQPPGVNNNPANPEQTAPEPKKYMGGSIPSRSFRMLQAMTGSDDATGPGDPANSSESSSQPEDDTQHTANQIPSPNCKSSVPTSPTSLSPSHVSSDSGISSPSKIGPYATGKDSRVYRHVSPVVNLNGSKERVVNSALSNAPSSPTWKIESPQPTDIIRTVDYSSTNSENEGSPRLMGILRDESVSPNPQNVEKRYEGGYIPSRVFRHLHAEYSGDSNELQDHRGQHSMKSLSPRYDGSPIPPRVLKSIQNEANSSFDSDTTDGENPSRASSSLAELDEYYHNGIARTAVTKDTVLKELAAQFDHAGTRKKPKAAPGRVFRYLQSQYDTPEDSVDQQQAQQRKNDLQPETQEVSGLGYQRSNVPSPSFKFLQSQYKQPEQSQPTKSTPQSSSSNTMEGKQQAFSNSGCPVPGRTFKSLQDNVATHPSVFKPRK